MKPLKLESVVGIILTLYLLSGRWSLSILLEEMRGFLFLSEVRFWSTFLLLVIVPFFSLNERASFRSSIGKTSLVIMLFISYMIITICWAPSSSILIWKAYELLLILLTTLTFCKVIKVAEGEPLRSSIWTSIFVISGLLALIAIILVVKGGVTSRLSVLGGGPNVFGRNMGLLMLAGLYFWVRTQKRWIVLPTTIVAGISLLLSGSRGSLVASIVSVVTFFFFERIGSKRLFLLVTSASVILLLIITFSSLGSSAGEVIKSRFLPLMFEDVYMAGRDEIYSGALNMGMENPIVGNGLAAFYTTGLGTYPHNIFLEIFAEGGSIGLLLFLMSLVVFVKPLWLNRSKVDGASVSGFMLIFTASQFSGDLYDSRGVFFFMLLALMLKEDVNQQPSVSASEYDKYSKSTDYRVN